MPDRSTSPAGAIEAALESAGFSGLAFLGAGRYSNIYQATDSLGGEVAVRVIRFRSQLKHESRSRRNRLTYWLTGLLLGAGHPNLVHIHRTGRLTVGGPDGPERLLYVVMDLVQGSSIHQMIPTGELRELGFARAMAAFERALDVARFLKSRFLRHGDMETVNLMISDRGEMMVIDFEPRLGIGKGHRRDLVKLRGTLSRMLAGILDKSEAMPVDVDTACRYWFPDGASDDQRRIVADLARFAESIAEGGELWNAPLARVCAEFAEILVRLGAVGAQAE